MEDIIIAVVDGQGGGIGRAIIEILKKEIPNAKIRALGSNSLATSNMLKGGANDGATGENAIIVNVKKAHIIMGVVAILMPNSLLGELTPKMSHAIGTSDAMKILVPVDRCNIRIAIAGDKSLQKSISYSVELAKQHIDILLTDNNNLGSL